MANNEWFKELKAVGYPLPTSYLVFDLETTGVEIDKDLVVQLGYLNVIDDVPQAPVTCLLNWSECQDIDHEWLKNRLFNTKQRMAEKGSNYLFTYDDIINKGKNYKDVLTAVYLAFKEHEKSGCYFLGHNSFTFDKRFLLGQFHRFLELDFNFHPLQQIDTGLLAKAASMNIAPISDLERFYHTTYKSYGKGHAWGLVHCIEDYGLTAENLINIQNAHNAGYDCYLTHLLFQKFKQLANQ